MAQLGWVHPGTGAETPFTEALDEAHRHGSWANVPYEVLAGMHKNLDKSDRPTGASVTQLLGCPRRVHLERLVDFYGDVMGSYAAFRGALGHTMLENFTPGDAMVEKRYWRRYKGIDLSGALDSWRILNAPAGLTQEWHDWLEMMAVWETEPSSPSHDLMPIPPELPDKAVFLIRDWKSRHELPFGNYMPVKHQKQANLYRWLLRIPKERVLVEFVYFSMEGIKVIPLYSGGFYRNGRAKPEQVMSDAEVLSFLDERLVPLALQERLDRPIPYDRVTDDDLWNCKYCPAIRLCHKRAAEEARAAWKKGETYDRLPPR